MRETNKAKQAFEDYFNMGAGRSLSRLHKKYTEGTLDNAITRHLRTLKKWSTKHGWQVRVGEREQELAEAKFEAIKSKAEEAGYAFWPKRVEDLVALAELLLEEINEEEKRWLPDVKSIGSGYSAKVFHITRFNSALIEQFRRTLDDIAAEMGERTKGVVVTGKDGGPIVIDHGATARESLFSRLLSGLAGEREAESARFAD